MGPVAGVLLHSFVTGPAGELFSPVSRAAGYVGNTTMPNIIPDIGTTLELYLMGLIRTNQFKQLMLWHGCEVDKPGQKKPFSAAWTATLEANQAFPDPMQLMRGLRTGQIDPDLYSKWMRRHKIANSDVKAYLEKMNYEPLALGELIALWNRKQIGEDVVDLHLKDRGVTDPIVLAAVKELRKEIPPITDLLHFAQVNATDPLIIARFGLADEFGRFWQGDLQKGLEAQGISQEWAKIYWQAHWIRPAVGQAQEALQRLRPGRVAAGEVFTRQDFENVMRENDVLPFWREKLRLMAYQPPSLRFIRTLFQTDVWNQADVSEGYQDIGYSPDVAPQLAKSELYIKRRALAAQGHGYSTAKAIAHYKENILSADQVANVYTFLGYDAATIKDAIGAADNDLAAEHLKTLIAVLRQQFLHGQVDAATATARLTALTLPPARIGNLVGQWQAERELHAPHATLAQLGSWVQLGLLSLADYAARLGQLGYAADVITRLVAVQAGKLDHHRAAELSALEKEHKRHAMHAFAAGKAMTEADLLNAVAAIDADAAESLLDAHTAEEKEDIKTAAKLHKAAAKAAAKAKLAAAKLLIDDMPPP